MESQDLKQTLRNLLKETGSVEEAYSAYAKVIDEEVNSANADEATHEVTWGERPVSGNRIENVLRSLARIFTKMPKPMDEPFQFKSQHKLDSHLLQELRAEQERGVELENLSGLAAGVAMWMFALSLVMILFVKTTAVVLVFASILAFFWASFVISNVHFKNLPTELRNISADHWSIKRIENKTR